MPDRTELVGAEAAFRDLETVADRVAKAADLEARRASERLVSLVVPRVPKVSGALAGSLGVVDVGEGAAAGYDGSVAYAGYIEFGGFHGRPYVDEGRYLYPTATTEGDRFVADLEQTTERTIGGMSWSTRPT